MKEKKERNITRILSHSEKETEAAGMLLAGLLKKGDFVALYGDLGAGKTAFVRGIAAVVTPGAEVSSPTYTIVNEYQGAQNILCHFDMYTVSKHSKSMRCIQLIVLF